MTICYRVVTEAAYHARRAVRHIGHGIAHHAMRHVTLHSAAAVVSVVCVATPAVLWASLPPAAPAVSEVCCVFRTTPPDPLAPSPQLVSPAYRFADLAPADTSPATDVPAPAMGWIVLLPLVLRSWWK